VTPEEAGVERTTLARLKGGTAEENAGAIRALFEGQRTPFRDIVLLNSGGALVVAGMVGTITEGVALAARAIDSGLALSVLEKSRSTDQRK